MPTFIESDGFGGAVLVVSHPRDSVEVEVVLATGGRTPPDPHLVEGDLIGAHLARRFGLCGDDRICSSANYPAVLLQFRFNATRREGISHF